MRQLALAIPLIVVAAAPAAAQDIRGIENCTAEKTMERRTSCLQSNVDYLQQTLARQRRDARAQLDAMSREVVAQKAEIAALRSTLAKLERELMDLKKEKPAGK